MGGLDKTAKRVANFSLGKGYKTNDERRAEKDAANQKALDSIYSGAKIPDDEAIKRNERRKAAKRRGSRVNTVLTDRDKLG